MAALITSFSDPELHDLEDIAEAMMREALERVMDVLAKRVERHDNRAAVTAAAPPAPPPDDGLPPGQPYVSPDDLASVAPLWDAEVAKLLPVVAQVYQDSAAKIHSGLVAQAALPDLPVAGSLAAEEYMATARNVYDDVGTQLWTTARAQLVEGFTAGESIPQLAQRLRDSAGLTAKNSVLVARSVVIEASNAGSIDTARATGLEMIKEWIATADARTRPTHKAADGQRVGLDEMFTVGGFSADAPGDPSLPPDEKYRCRCTLGYIMGKADVHAAHQEAHQQAQQDALPNTTPMPESTIGNPLSTIEGAESSIAPALAEDIGPVTVRRAVDRGSRLLPPQPGPIQVEQTVQEARAATRAAARARHAAISRAEPVARLQADIDSTLGAAGRPIRLSDDVAKSLEQALTDARQAGLSPDDLSRIERAVADRNPAAIEDTMARLANERGVVAQGARGEVVKYDPATMDPLSDEVRIRTGQRVEVWRQGHAFSIEGDTVQLDRTVVRTIPKPVAPAERPVTLVEPRGAPNESQPRLDELFQTLRRGKAAEKRVAEQAIKDGIDGRYGDLIVETDSVSSQRGVAHIAGRITDLDGNDVGEFSRHLVREADGKLVARHESLDLYPSVQGSGFAREFNQNLYDWYRRSGFDRVELYAANDVGGYAWATQGFDFADAEAFDMWASQVADSIADQRLGVTLSGATMRDLEGAMPRASAEEITAQLEQFKALLAQARSGDRKVSAFEFSQVGRQAGQGREDVWVGKWIMLRNHWAGVKPL